MEMCMEVKGLTKAFHGRRVVDKLSFSVNQGEVFGLLGHNGAGKSTTIEMMLGLKKSDEGSATIWGKDARMNRKEIRKISDGRIGKKYGEQIIGRRETETLGDSGTYTKSSNCFSG